MATSWRSEFTLSLLAAVPVVERPIIMAATSGPPMTARMTMATTSSARVKPSSPRPRAGRRSAAAPGGRDMPVGLIR
jgi:hypothetical protein